MLPNNVRDREQAKFRDTGLKTKTKVAVSVEQNQGDSIPVFLSSSGVPTNVYNEISSIASGSLADIISYTVPAGKTLSLISVGVSGDNIAEYTVVIDGIIFDKKKTWWGSSNEVFNIGGFDIAEGLIVKVIVNNFRPSVSNFNARIFGILK